MLVEHSATAQAGAPDATIARATDSISTSFLREAVKAVAIPRHYESEPENNRLTAHWIAGQLRSYGYETHLQGQYANIVAILPGRSVGATSRAAKTYRPDFPVLSLKVYVEIEKLFPVLARSDHTPFWKAGIPAVMWTDTSEFRNHHYHQATDQPNTLDYEFLRAVTQILIASVLISCRARSESTSGN